MDSPLKQLGLTLIEIMVVLVIVSILSGFVSITSKQRDSIAFASEVNQLQSYLQLASDMTLMQLDSVVFQIEESGYGLYRLQESGQLSLEEPKKVLWRSKQLPPSVRLEINENRLEQNFNQSTLSSSSQIHFFPGGEYEAFELSIISGERKRTLWGDGWTKITTKEFSTDAF